MNLLSYIRSDKSLDYCYSLVDSVGFTVDAAVEEIEPVPLLPPAEPIQVILSGIRLYPVKSCAAYQVRAYVQSLA